MKRNLKLVSKYINGNKERLISLILTLLLTLIIFLDSNYFNHALLTSTYVFSITFLVIALISIMLVAGHAIYKSAIHASVGFGVLIFLAQTYCALDTKTPDGIAALNTLWTIGFVFILYEFFYKLQEAYKAHTRPLRDDIKTKKWEPVLLIAIYSVFIIGYISLISKVLTPIVLDLCIYKP